MLQVGHLERFNPAILAAAGRLKKPRFVESHRLAPFKLRGTDVSVVLDLMIHDIDLIQELVGAPIESIDAVGASVFSGEIDIVNARIRFQGGCVANTTASRISMKQERKIRIFQDDAYLSIDLQQKVLTVIRKKDAAPVESPAQVSIEEESFDQGDALLAEIEAFLRSVREGSPPVVSGEDGLRALETAMQITRLVQGQRISRLQRAARAPAICSGRPATSCAAFCRRTQSSPCRPHWRVARDVIEARLAVGGAANLGVGSTQRQHRACGGGPVRVRAEQRRRAFRPLASRFSACL